MDVDWGLMVAVLSMFFTMFIGGITIWYTKNSLDYTKKSTQIADESLKAAQKSIDTSIEIYNKQKKDSENEYEAKKKEKLFSLKYFILNEISTNYANYRFMTNFCRRVIDDDILDFNIPKDDLSGVAYRTRNFNNYNLYFIKHESVMMEKHLFDIVELDHLFGHEIMKMIMNVKRYNDFFIHKMIPLINNNYDEDDDLKLYYYIKKSEKFICDYHCLITDILRDCLNINNDHETPE
ncbi:hypothetical protein I5E72_03010 [Proteus terrae]|uniref:hypothetical protein n=1 Tax=Proteus terrae TaxID=1574161 RepID=UPI0018C48A63|nr:hypothetical protein [Proteus terrae]MBG5948726.1 hypothetical protein [Proteus terrae]